MCQSESNEVRLAAINGYVKERVAEREKELDDIVAKLEKDFKKGKNFSSTEWNDQFWFIRWKIRCDIQGVKMRCDNLNNSNNGFKAICDMDEIPGEVR